MAKHKVKRYDKGGELSGAEEERKNQPEYSREQVGRGFGTDGTKLSADNAEFMAAKETANPVTVSSEKTINYGSNKPKIITMDQVKAAGYDNLRDYLNNKGASPTKPKVDTEIASRAVSRTVSKSEPSRTTMSAAPAKDTSNTYRDLSGKVKVKEPNGPAASQMASDMAMSGAKKIGSGISRVFKAIRERGENPTTMASGGMTSSASKRADGIATKGKTRGKIC